MGCIQILSSSSGLKTVIPVGIFCVANLAYILSMASSGTRLSGSRWTLRALQTSMGRSVMSIQGVAMCVMMSDGVLQGMSVVICVCGPDFCTFYAGGRKVVHDSSAPSGIRIVGDDHFPEVFKLNPRVLDGAAGWCGMDTDLRDPVQSIPDIQNAPVRVVKQAVVNYLKKEKSCSRILPHSFLVGGKNRGGSFSMFEIALDPQNDRVSVTDRSPSPPRNNFGLSMMLPINDQQVAQRTVSRTGELILQSKSLDELDHNISAIFYSISQMDETVGPSALKVSVCG